MDGSAALGGRTSGALVAIAPMIQSGTRSAPAAIAVPEEQAPPCLRRLPGLAGLGQR
jgi:hypothetical protein